MTCCDTNNTACLVPPSRVGLFSTLRSYSDFLRPEAGEVEKLGSRGWRWGERPAFDPAGAAVWAPGVVGLGGRPGASSCAELRLGDRGAVTAGGSLTGPRSCGNLACADKRAETEPFSIDGD